MKKQILLGCISGLLFSCTNLDPVDSLTELRVNVQVEGAISPYGGVMTTYLSKNNLLPHLNPFVEDNVGYAHSFPKGTVDWVLVDIKDSIHSLKGFPKALLLNKDGFLMDINGKYPRLDTDKSNLTIHIKQRNHISVEARLQNTGSYLAYIFRTPMIAGDYDQDQQITVNDFSGWGISITNTAGYYDADFNLDGFVDSLDFELWKTNFGK